MRIELGATLEAVEDDRILVGRDGRREWLVVRGPVLVSQGTVPAGGALHDPQRPTYVVGEAGTATSADQAIRDGATAGRAVR